MIKIAILTGYGINCEEETAYGFKLAGGRAEIVHINDVVEKIKNLKDFQILVFPGGFSYGDDTGSGNAFANRIKNHLWEEVLNFVEKDKLVIGICNGFQILVNLGLLPAVEGEFGKREAALTHNSTARYIDRWVDLKSESKSCWLAGIKEISLPIAHGEGRFYAEDKIIEKIKKQGGVALKYVEGEMCEYQNMEANPNGSVDDIAAINDKSGKILGMMPHPERAIFFHHLPNWQWLKEKYNREGRKIPKFGPGLKIFRNGINYFK